MDKIFKGLTSAQAEQSRNQFGSNQLAKKETDSLWDMLLGSFNDIWIKVLCFTLVIQVVIAIISSVTGIGEGGNGTEIIGVLVAIVLATGFSTISEFRNVSRSEAL